LDGLNVTAIAALYDVHQTTASRWFARIGVLVEHSVRRELSGKLGLPQPELDSVVRSLLSQIDESLCSEVSRALRNGEK
jgi:RNA polymerase sigma-70 factor (ECF subfamily)